MSPSLLYILWFALLSNLFRLTCGSPLTIELNRNGNDQRECYYILTTDLDCTISYYFAVQHGSNNDFYINYEIFAPDDQYKPIISKTHERQGEWAFVGEHRGEYKICFDSGNKNEKIVDFEINYKCNSGSSIKNARNERREKRKTRRNIKDTNGGDALQQSIEDSLDNIERRLYSLESNMQYYKNRNQRNHHTVKSTEKRITMFSIYGILLIVAMCGIQLFVLEWVFKRSRR
ncbi:hypothetical protein NCAS_0I01860 [Naumovozyma castellii]|uniref:GOLD domain-containing protein n=1 Tax=Naumovozyma castellii TaxID=27288 RepID=G0VK20_NAUCA|nr:hypothetical protein NCAS_0I01860 [Naumovozyma castellii CBS 4309]CCC71854.1 hypothetical protein NCAS_0I01860 [Naumovozyma castellii CBS 4309]